jgi:hypothetical protein
MMNIRHRWNGMGVPTQSHPNAASLTLSAWNISLLKLWVFLSRPVWHSGTCNRHFNPYCSDFVSYHGGIVLNRTEIFFLHIFSVSFSAPWIFSNVVFLCFNCHVVSVLLYNGYRVSFLVLKRSGSGIDHRPYSSDGFKNG